MDILAQVLSGPIVGNLATAVNRLVTGYPCDVRVSLPVLAALLGHSVIRPLQV